jgi:hypothetical protein
MIMLLSIWLDIYRNPFLPGIQYLFLISPVEIFYSTTFVHRNVFNPFQQHDARLRYLRKEMGKRLSSGQTVVFSQCSQLPSLVILFYCLPVPDSDVRRCYLPTPVTLTVTGTRFRWMSVSAEMSSDGGKWAMIQLLIILILWWGQTPVPSVVPTLSNPICINI